MTRILVTGGAGIIGSHTVVELVKAGFRPVIVDDFSNSEHFIVKRLEQLTDQKIASYKLDYRNTNKPAKIIDEENITGIIHFAAYKAVGESMEHPLNYY